jgi:hypothetical protein
MEVSKQELAAVQVTVTEGMQINKELSEMQLVLAGGGLGDITLG